jgi:thymidylate synthase
MVFKNANEAFNHFYYRINEDGIVTRNTKALFNVGFVIENPLDNIITNKNRDWSLTYAVAEWQWYLSADRSIYKLEELYGSIPKIWRNIADENGLVNSNYGAHWFGNNQYDKVVEILKKDSESRRASLSIYNANDIDQYEKDTPCTYAINFSILDNKLNMTVMMRSNDLWFGFCNDQYCFSKLQEKMSKDLDIEVGTYFHFVNNLHLYNRHLI